MSSPARPTAALQGIEYIGTSVRPTAHKSRIALMARSASQLSGWSQSMRFASHRSAPAPPVIPPPTSGMPASSPSR